MAGVVLGGKDGRRDWWATARRAAGGERAAEDRGVAAGRRRRATRAAVTVGVFQISYVLCPERARDSDLRLHGRPKTDASRNTPVYVHDCVLGLHEISHPGGFHVGLVHIVVIKNIAAS